jgi:hypothetical protein
MSLAAGSKLGPYEIQSPLGAGGVGEVYLKRYVPDQTICPKVRCALYVDFEPLLRLSLKATQSSRWRRQNGDWPYPDRDADFGSLMQAELNKSLRLGSTWSGADEQMVQLCPHARQCNSI